MSPVLALLHCGTMTSSHQGQATIPHLKKSSGLPFLEQSKIIAFHQLKAAANPGMAEFGRYWSKADIGHSCYLLWRDAIDPLLKWARRRLLADMVVPW